MCAGRFSDKHKLKRHIDTIHDGKKPHACSICKKHFSENRYLQLHMGTHHKIQAGIKTEQCLKVKNRIDGTLENFTENADIWGDRQDILSKSH